MRTLRQLSTLLSLSFVLVLAACGDDDSNGNGQPDAGGDQGTDQGTDQSTPDQVTPDQSLPDQAGACDDPNDNCFTPLPSSTGVPRVMINAIDLEDDWVEIKNVNTVDADLTGWFVCQRPNYQPLPSITLAPAQVLRIHLNQSGTDTEAEIFIPAASPLTRDDEIAFYSSNNFESSADIEVYVRWGSPAEEGGRSIQADQAGLWRQGTFVPVCGDNTGIVCTGDCFQIIGYHDIPGTCPAMQ